MSSQRVKVEVAALIKRIEDAKAADKLKFHKELKQYNADQEKYVLRVKEALQKALASIEATGKVPETYYGDLKVRVTMQRPTTPYLRDDSYDRDINLLKLAVEPTIVISTDSNYGKYL